MAFSKSFSKQIKSSPAKQFTLKSLEPKGMPKIPIRLGIKKFKLDLPKAKKIKF